MNNKVLLVLWGESFRSGGQMTRTRGTGDYFAKQKSATLSHLELLDRIRKKHSLECDILLNSFTLNPEDDDSLISWYSDHGSKFIYHLHSKGFATEEETRRDTYSKAVDIIDDYEYVLFARVDLFFKKYFIDNFYFNDEKILFAHMDVSSNAKKFIVCDQIMLFPKKLFYTIKEEKIGSYSHDTVDNLLKHDKSLINKIDYFIHTLHICSTDLGWNPLYTQVGRKTNNSYDINTYYDIEKREFKKDSNLRGRYID
jgi:hypothetical protein